MIVTMSGCCTVVPKDPMRTEFMWICNNPKIVLNYQCQKSALEPQCWLIQNGERVDIVTDYRANLFWVELPGPRSDERTLLQGKWKYQGDKLIFMIEKDNIFDGAYKTLVFTKKE